MNNLAHHIAKQVRQQVAKSIQALASPSAEWRSFFHGPPDEFLNLVFCHLTADGFIKIELVGDERIDVPVLFVQQGFRGPNPAVGKSGACDVNHLLNCRNSLGQCPKFVALLGPGMHANMSLDSAQADFGLAPQLPSIYHWWRDDFVQALAAHALALSTALNEAQREQATQLMARAAEAADSAERSMQALQAAGASSSSRSGAWLMLSRMYGIIPNVRADHLVALACGYPPSEDSSVSAREQSRMLAVLADHLEANGFGPGIEILKERADRELREALAAFAEHLRRVCDLPSAFRESTPYYYGPCRGSELETPPGWWSVLTLEAWATLLDEEEELEGGLTLKCGNPIFDPPGNSPWITRGGVTMLAGGPEGGTVELKAEVTRKAGGAAPLEIPVVLPAGEAASVDDTNLPVHATPLRYSLEAENFKTASIKVVDLGKWRHGVVAFCRNAIRYTVPKPARTGTDLECSMTLQGSGRHYIDIYTVAGVIVRDFAVGQDSDEVGQEPVQARVGHIDDSTHGFDALVGENAHYDIEFRLQGDTADKTLRIHLTCEELDPLACRSEFERLIIQHRESRGVSSRVVQIDRNTRCATLQQWLLEKEQAAESFYPLVLSSDYADAWSKPAWSHQQIPPLSRRRFLHDPRPMKQLFVAPEVFRESRRKLAEIIRGEDDDHIEKVQLGRFLATDTAFAELLQGYLRSYLEWVEAEPAVAIWVDVLAFCSYEQDGFTLRQTPEAVIIGPLHPLRLAWQALAQRTLFMALQGHKACPAASVLDPHSVPDVLHLPLHLPDGSVEYRSYFAVESSSDYWSVLWNGQRLDMLQSLAEKPPFTQEFGLRIGGIASGFSATQVIRALDDVSDMLAAKPVLDVIVTSASGQTNACNVGLSDWGRRALTLGEESNGNTIGSRVLNIYDERKEASLPDETDVSNLAEDTGNALKWYSSAGSSHPGDLGIIAQLETANLRERPAVGGATLGWGGLIRHRVRRQLQGGEGAFLAESRACEPRPPCGDGLGDLLIRTLTRLENLTESKAGLEFSPSIISIKQVLERVDFAAVSSSAVDPACFLGNWLEGSYLWDYQLPSYSQRSGDTNGYYLLSRVKIRDRDSLRKTLSRLPGMADLTDEEADAILLEVARRGIPTVRGLSSGHNGAAGDLGLMVACRLLQDCFRRSGNAGGLLPTLQVSDDAATLCLIIPVDPFQGYVDDLQRALEGKPTLRPDLLVVGIRMTDSSCSIRLTPLEVKFRQSPMSMEARIQALGQAKVFSSFLRKLDKAGQDPAMLLWQIAYRHLLTCMISFGLRVYSQQYLVSQKSDQYAKLHSRTIGSILNGEAQVTIDDAGRLIVMDGSAVSMPFDCDSDDFKETVVLSLPDAASIVRESTPDIVESIKARLGSWNALPAGAVVAPMAPAVAAAPSQAPAPDSRPPASAAQTFASAPQPMVRAAQAVDGAEQASAGAQPTPPGSTEPELVQPELPVQSGHPVGPDQGICFAVGESNEHFSSKFSTFSPSDTRLNQLNIGVVGDLGTGKTQFLKALVARLSRSAPQNRGIKPRVLIFDYKRDYSSSPFVDAVGGKVYKPQNLPLNFFDLSAAAESTTPWLDRFNFFADVLDKIYSGIGPVQRKQLKTAVRTSYDQALSRGNSPTIYDVHAEYQRMLGGRADAVLSIIDDFVDRKLFEPDPRKIQGFDSFLDGVVVIDLAALGADDHAKNMLVAIMLNMFYEHMLRIEKRPFIGSSPQLRAVDSFLLVDEADNIMKYEFDVLRKVLLQGREFGVGVILSSQYLSHFKSGATNYREPLLTWFIHKVPNITPNELQSIGMTTQAATVADRVRTLQVHWCLYKSHDGVGEIIEGIPFFKL
jgi:DNA phosphorothioation-dependent restriction protein DptH